jgi:hypothetical protein
MSATRLTATAAAAAVATLPLLYYHAAITYLEVAVLAIGCYIALLFLRHDRCDRGFVLRVAAVAAAIVPIKETGAPLAVAAAVVLAARILVGLDAAWHRRLAVAVGATALIVIPGALYFAFVAIVGGGRSHPQGWEQLAQWETYRRVAVAGWAQFGPIGLAAIFVGFVFAVMNRRAAWAVGLVSMNALLCAVVFFTDHDAYIGYSRFTLCFSPLVVLAVIALSGSALARRLHDVRVQPVLLTAIALASFLTAPRSLERRENWGSLHTDTAEYYYPYDRAVESLASIKPKSSFYVSGLTYPYHVLFYVRRTGMDFRQCMGVNADGLTLPESIETAAANGAAYLLFHHASPVDASPPAATPGARWIERFAIGRRALDLFDVSGVAVSGADSRPAPAARSFAERLIGNDDPHEPDDSPQEAGMLVPGEPSAHSIGDGGRDVDWLRFDLDRPSRVDILVAGPTGDTFMQLFSSNNTIAPLASDDDRGPSQFSRIQCPRLPVGRYFVRVEQVHGDMPISAYDVTLSSEVIGSPPSAEE